MVSRVPARRGAVDIPMINHRMIVLAALLAWVVPAQAADEVELQSLPYADKLVGGFSLRPPANTARAREPSTSRLVSWVSRDARNNAVAWSLSVMRGLEKKEVDLKPYSEALGKKLQAEQNMDVESIAVTQIGGKGAIVVQGVCNGLLPQWQRQAWVLTKPNRFLIFVISGPPDMKDSLGKIHQAVMATVKIIDPEEALAEQKVNLDRGRELLAALTDEKLQGAVDPARWYLLHVKDATVGWMAQIEAVKTRTWSIGKNFTTGQERFDHAVGVEIRTIAWMNMQGQERLHRRLMFTNGNGVGETWEEILNINDGKDPNNKVTLREQGIRQTDSLVCTVGSGAKGNDLRKQIPVDIYLPRATGLMLPRLLDLKKPATYAFASYSAQVNDFELRTVTVAAAETLVINGESIPCVQVQDVVAGQNETTSASWVDAQGKLVRMKGAEDFMMELSTPEKVAAKYPQAPAQLAELRR